MTSSTKQKVPINAKYLINLSAMKASWILFSSLLLFIASPGKFSAAPVIWVALVPLLLAVPECGPRKAARLGLLGGFVYYLAILYWILIVLGKYGNLPLWLSIPALALLALYMSLFLSLFCAAIAWRKDLPLIWIAPPLWVALDFLRGRLFSGFPWMDLGYTQYQFPKLIQFADLTGHFGITFIIVMFNCLIVSLIKLFSEKQTAIKKSLLLYQVAPALLILAAATAYNLTRYSDLQNQLANFSEIKVGVVQGNIDQSQKWLPSSQENTVETYLSLSEQLLLENPLDLLIWPETALPFFPNEHPMFTEIISQMVRPGNPTLVTGAPHYQRGVSSQQISYHNSAFVISAAKQQSASGQPYILQRYDKQHLVPFGEYIPFAEYLPSSMPIVHSMGNFSPGNSTQPISCDKSKIGVLICYESIFPELGRQEVENGANLLVNLTNDAWYGDSSAPWQQLAMVVFRAIENRRSFARAANTGISCFVDPLGNLLKTSALFKQDKLTETLPILTLMSIYNRMGYLFPHLCILIIALLGLANKRKEIVQPGLD